MKFSSKQFTITKSYDEVLRNKRDMFMEETGTRKAIHLTMLTTYGVEHNEYWGNIQSELTMEDLSEKKKQCTKSSTSPTRTANTAD